MSCSRKSLKTGNKKQDRRTPSGGPTFYFSIAKRGKSLLIPLQVFYYYYFMIYFIILFLSTAKRGKISRESSCLLRRGRSTLKAEL